MLKKKNNRYNPNITLCLSHYSIAKTVRMRTPAMRKDGDGYIQRMRQKIKQANVLNLWKIGEKLKHAFSLRFNNIAIKKKKLAFQKQYHYIAAESANNQKQGFISCQPV